MSQNIHERGRDEAADAVEEAGETTAADSVETPADTRPVGTGTLVETDEARERDE